MGRRGCTLDPMRVSVVLRLLPGPLGEGEVVGQVEVVSTGEQVAVNGLAELLAVLVDAGRAARELEPNSG